MVEYVLLINLVFNLLFLDHYSNTYQLFKYLLFKKKNKKRKLGQAGQAGRRPAIMAGPHTEKPRPLGRPIWPGRDREAPASWPVRPGDQAGQRPGVLERAVATGGNRPATTIFWRREAEPRVRKTCAARRRCRRVEMETEGGH